MLLPSPDLPLDIVYVDDSLVIVDKRAGIPCHPLRPDESGTLMNAVVARFPETAAAGPPREGGLAHRIDNDTSGLVVIARTSAIREALRALFSAGKVGKRYRAWVVGEAPPSGEINYPLRQKTKGGPRVEVARSLHAKGARRAFTRFHRVFEAPNSGPRSEPAQASREHYRSWINERVGAPADAKMEPPAVYSCVDVLPTTGHRHQIRVHLSAIGHPIVGDVLYGGPPAPVLLLRAVELRFIHPSTGKLLVVVAAAGSASNSLTVPRTG